MLRRSVESATQTGHRQSERVCPCQTSREPAWVDDLNRGVERARKFQASYKGADLSIAFNPGYLMDPLKNLDNDEVFLELIDELSPGVVKINGPFLYVLMPMRMS